ncbi:MAG: D-alanyl-D-alanine carboxypeptidase/D-alanyl-D-alanine-endopeptidase (penicillin-binding protein 4) [Roseivirga sp.]|jgi:D-alanyl-D-alanine carboxypeptidase/D-alanyl-D-alanine-endopeptidase (penicillin-binding protein 4)
MSKRLLLLLILASLCSQLHAQRYSKKKILKDLKELDGFKQAFVGFVLTDPETGKTIACQYDNKYMTPASNTKLFTFYAGLHFLGTNVPAMQYTIKGDSLIFWGTGNPLFLHTEHQDSTALAFLRSRKENLYYWERPIEDERFGPGWGWDDYNGYYSAEKSAFPIYGNSVTAYINKEQKTLEVMPKYFQKDFIAKVNTLTRLSTFLERKERENTFYYAFPDSLDFEIEDYQPVDTLMRPFMYSTDLFIKLLKHTLNKEITVIEGQQDRMLAQTLYSISTDSLYKKMLLPSDNLFAEQILLMASGLNSDTLSSKSMIKIAKERLFNDWDDELVWVDGSGLSRYNMFTPRAMNKLLTLLRQELGEERLFSLLPVGGESGTLEDWYEGNPAPYVYAKTGTLSNNHTLSGYIKTDKGKTLIFTLMVNHYEHTTSKVRKSMGVILEKIRKAY